MTLLTGFLLAFAVIGWLLAIGAFRLINAKQAAVDRLDAENAALTESRDYNRKAKCRHVRKVIGLEAQLQGRTHPDVVHLDRLAHHRLTHEPGVN